MRRIIYRASSVALVLLTAILTARSASSRAGPGLSQAVFKEAQIDEPTLLLFQRSCQNCHSENTRWPWYSPHPTGVLDDRKDIADARRLINFSRWNSYPAVQPENLLTRIGAAARTGRMPLPRYTLLHRESILTSEERRQIYQWSRAGERLRAAG